jgi:hypothetical protein
MAQTYQCLAVGVLVIHLAWILWVVFGTLFTRHRPVLRWLHIASLVYSILIELLPWPPCPLTALEGLLEARAGIVPYHEPFLVHYLDALVYPDIPVQLLVGCAVAVCLFNLGVYVVRFRRRNSAGW